SGCPIVRLAVGKAGKSAAPRRPKEKQDGKTLTTGSHQDGKAGARFGEQTPPPRRRARGSNSRNRQDLPDSRGGFVPGRPADRKLLVPGPDGFRQDSHRGGHGPDSPEQSQG